MAAHPGAGTSRYYSAAAQISMGRYSNNARNWEGGRRGMCSPAIMLTVDTLVSKRNGKAPASAVQGDPVHGLRGCRKSARSVWTGFPACWRASPCWFCPRRSLTPQPRQCRISGVERVLEQSDFDINLELIFSQPSIGLSVATRTTYGEHDGQLVRYSDLQ